jgi:hypothetical protein
MLDKAALEDNGRFDVVVVADLVERRIMGVLLKDRRVKTACQSRAK